MMSRNIFKETQSWIDENLKPKTCRFRIIVISYNSLPECQCDGNFSTNYQFQNSSPTENTELFCDWMKNSRWSKISIALLFRQIVV